MNDIARMFSRWFRVGALIVLLLATGCNLPVSTPSAVGTILPTGPLPTPMPSATLSVAPTALIPITGTDVASLQCEFCVNDQAHAVLIMSEQASFIVSDPVVGINCMTAQVVNGHRIVFCRGAQQTSFNLNICIDNANCVQFPVTLANCGTSPQTGGIAPKPTFTAVTPVVASPVITQFAPTLTISTVTPIPTQVPPTLPASTATSAPTQTAATPQAATGTHAQPTRATVLGTQQPGTGIQDPADFVRWYFNQVWTSRNYQQLWDTYLTAAFKAVVSPGGFTEYSAWWSSVQRVDVNSVSVVQNNGTRAWVRVNLTFTMNDGRVISNQEYDYALTFNPNRQTWMFDLFP